MDYFHWNLDPEIFRIYGPIGIRWYSLFFLGGILLGHHLFGRILAREGKNVELRDPLLTYIFLGTILGARLGHCLFYNPMHYLQNPMQILKTWEGGLASHGGFTGVAIALYFFCRNYKEVRLLWLTDRICILAILAGASIRFGNFFNSEIVGLPSTLPWAVVFERVDQIARHPSQLYEAFGYIGIAGILSAIYFKRSHLDNFIQGSLFGWALILGFGFRFLVEFVKENQVAYAHNWTINTGQYLSIPFVVFGFFMVLGVPQSFFEVKQLQPVRSSTTAGKKNKKRKAVSKS